MTRKGFEDEEQQMGGHILVYIVCVQLLDVTLLGNGGWYC